MIVPPSDHKLSCLRSPAALPLANRLHLRQTRGDVPLYTGDVRHESLRGLSSIVSLERGQQQSVPAHEVSLRAAGNWPAGQGIEVPEHRADRCPHAEEHGVPGEFDDGLMETDVVDSGLRPVAILDGSPHRLDNSLQGFGLGKRHPARHLTGGKALEQLTHGVAVGRVLSRQRGEKEPATWAAHD